MSMTPDSKKAHAEQPAKPAPMPVDANEVPQELRELDRWVFWRWKWNGAKWDKPPLQCRGRAASSSEPSTWCSFDEALAAFNRGGFDGIGFVFVPEDGFCGIDLDDCRDPANGELTEFAKWIIGKTATYTEVSPSGTGVKLVCRGKLPPGQRVDHKKGIETYSQGRYFTVTGQRLPDASTKCEERTQELAALLPSIFAKSPSAKSKDHHRQNGNAHGRRDDREVALEALHALNKSRAAGYHDWLGVGQALHSVDSSDAMCLEWDRWSQSCREKYVDGECEKKWRSFDGGRGLTLGSLIYWGREDGWSGPSRRRTNHRTNGHASTSNSDIESKYKLTDYGNAERLCDRFGNDIRYCHPWRKWLFWDGRRWTEDQVGRLKQFAKQTVRGMWSEVEGLDGRDDREDFAEHVLRSESAQRLNALIELARDEYPILPAQLDTNPWLLNCINGTIDLKTGQLREHRREDYITKLCPVPFDPAAQCPLWQKFLSDIFEHQQRLIEFMQRLVGHCLTGDVTEQILLILYGVGANGKSTLLNILLKMLGSDFAMQGIPDLLMSKRSESHPTERADLFGKRLVSCVETEDGRALAESLVKQLTGGERIRARRMNEDFWEFDATHKIFLCTNHKPRIRGTDHAIWRRIRLIPFNVKFWNPDKGESGPPELRQDKLLASKLEMELPGILAWGVRGCLEWQLRGLGAPEEVNSATQAYQAEQDIVGQWEAECCIRGVMLKAKASDLCKNYREWCEVRGEYPLPHQRFGAALVERGLERYTSNGTWYRGIGLLADVLEGVEPHGTDFPPGM